MARETAFTSFSRRRREESTPFPFKPKETSFCRTSITTSLVDKILVDPLIGGLDRSRWEIIAGLFESCSPDSIREKIR